MSSGEPLNATTVESSTTPPPARPRKEGNESLWKRARRTLGPQNLTFLQTQSRPTVTTDASAPNLGPAAPSKRREQVRHAQRTHRQRTQNYIKTLESEVVRLRESEARLVTERDNLQNTIQTLKITIISANLPLPPGVDDPEPTSLPPAVSQYDMPATISYGQDELNHQRLHVSWPDPSAQASATAYIQQPYGMSSPYDNQHSFAQKPLPDFPNDFSLDPISVSGHTSPSAERRTCTTATDAKASAVLDTIENAIDFVLALEHPCMAHIPYPPESGGAEPANHMMMASTPLVARAPLSPKDNPNTSWTASGAIIKELLNLSSGINLEGEITPVEAWHRLHAHPEFSRLDPRGLEALKKQLSVAVRCYG
ncbi:MAG: hypothetical protein Q9217_005849 [Psora testacea]